MVEASNKSGWKKYRNRNLCPNIDASSVMPTPAALVIHPWMTDEDWEKITK